MKKNKNLIAVYGSLRKGLGNHRLIKNEKFLGEFITPPTYSLFSIGAFPGLKRSGNTAITMEVYEVSDDTLSKVNRLEGYKPDSDQNHFYDRFEIDTPYGKAYSYVYIPFVGGLSEVTGGDWKNYRLNLQESF